MRVLVTGADGMLGSDFCRVLTEEGHEVVRATRAIADVTNLSSVRAIVADARAALIIHTAAHTNADEGERQPDLAYRVNALGAWNVALAAAESGAQIVYVSSCGVFDGQQSTPYREIDSPAPVTQHHRSKLEGERLVRSVAREHFILRAGWLFGGERNHKRNFVAQRFREASGKERIHSAIDRFGSPTYTVDFARAAIRIISTQAFGTYHVVNDGVCSRYEYVEECVRALGLRTEVVPVTSESFPRSAPVPASEALEAYYMRLRGLPPMRPWREALREYVAERLLPELLSEEQRIG